jgi:hypothetical protein
MKTRKDRVSGPQLGLLPCPNRQYKAQKRRERKRRRLE